ncbi:MAG: hypothetical protein KDB37_14915 [Ilumatobacter sp.]|nr:hypothetical protein [Ilumatobacter sp.]
MNSTLRRAAAGLSAIAATAALACVPAAGSAVASGPTVVSFDESVAAGDPTGEIASIADRAVQVRTVDIDAGSLATQFDGGDVVVELFDDLHVAVDAAVRTAGVDGGTLWRATGVGSALSITIDGDEVRATGIAQGRPFSITPSGAGHHLIAEHSTASPGRLDHVEPDPDVEVPKITAADVAQSSRQRAADTTERATAATTMRTVRVLTVFTADASSWYGGDGNAQGAIEAMVNDTNTVLANSNIDTRIVSAGIRPVAYSAGFTPSDDLDALTYGDTQALFGVLVDREILDADVIMMVRGPAVGSGCGVAWVLSAQQRAANDDLAIGVIDTECAPAPEYGYAHELGHLFGAQHGMGDNQGSGAHSFSNGYRAPVGAPGGRYRTVMAYEDSLTCECPVVPYFSAPRTIAGIGPIGSAGQDNARTLNLTSIPVAAYRPLPLWTFSPERLLETRNGPTDTTVDGQFRGVGERGAGTTLQLQVGGRGSVPNGVDAVLMNVTAIAPDGAGHITVWPCDRSQPTASNLNYGPGQVVANTVLAKLDAQGRVCIYTHARMHLIADASAWSPGGGSFRPVDPARLLETRNGPTDTTVDGQFQGQGARPAGSVVAVQVAGRGNVPPDATAAMFNVTAVAPAAAGHITMWPCDQQQPTTSSLNAGPGQVVANAVFSKLDSNGFVCLYTHATTHLIVDVAAAVTVGSPLVPIQPARVAETRIGTEFTTVDGYARGIGAIPGGYSYAFGIVGLSNGSWAGRGGVDPDAWTLITNVTAVTPEQAGHITSFPCGDVVPTASNLNYAPGQVVANMVVADLSYIENLDAWGMCLYTHGTTHMIVDVVAWM